MIRFALWGILLSAAGLSAQDAGVSSDLLVGGNYLIVMKPGVLTTGDTLRGSIEDKTDTSIIVEAAGVPYIFNPSLIASYTLISGPAAQNVVDAQGCRVYTYEELIRKQGTVGEIKVTLSNNASFTGFIIHADSATLQLNVSGSVIPITPDIVSSFVSAKPLVVKKPDPAANLPKEPELPPDSVWINQVDQYGQAQEPLLLIGRITGEIANGYSFKSLEGTSRTFTYAEVSRVNRHVFDSAEEKLKRYALPLNCPPDMVLSTIPPGMPDKPFFRTCVDRYEYPNRRDGMPRSNVSYATADSLCKNQGKRLCSSEEWQWSCSGIEGQTFPYGNEVGDAPCNRTTIAETSGYRPKCAGKLGIYDMTGNVFEWTTGDKNMPTVMGGPMAKCQTALANASGVARPGFGFRCCKSN